MGRHAKLTYTSNPNLQSIIGQEGELTCLTDGRYQFIVKSTGDIMTTSVAQRDTISGSTESPSCRNLGFRTHSGTRYEFDFLDYEKVQTSRYAKLSHTSNPKLQEFVGQEGMLTCLEDGSYEFRMKDNGKIITTSSAQPGTTLGSVSVPVCRNIGFQTNSGSHYGFEFMDVEKLHDGVRREGNQFIGFEHDYSLDGKMNNAVERADAHNAGVQVPEKGVLEAEFIK